MSTLDEILNGIEISDLMKLYLHLSKSYNLEVLKGKTQIKNEAVEREDLDLLIDDTSSFNTRYNHSMQVSDIAGKITEASGLDEKKQFVSRIIGMCHDLGHTPFGHDGELMFGEKITGNPKEFKHSKYGAKIFETMFEVILEQKDEYGNYIFNPETRSAISELGPYISAGIELHDSSYYSFNMDKRIKELEEKVKANEEKYEELLKKEKNGNIDDQEKEELYLLRNEKKELDTLRMAQEPCVQAAMLSDTVAIMQSDTHDISIASKAYSKEETLVNQEQKLDIAKDIGFSEEELDLLLTQLSKNPEDFKDKTSEEKLQAILELLGDIDYTTIQTIMALSIGEKGLNENGRFESVSDEYKLLADDYKEEYINYIEATMPEGEERDALIDRINSDWERYRQEALQEQRDMVKANNPLLCLTYELQNTLMYKEILRWGTVKELDNDVEINQTIFNRTWDAIEEIYCKSEEELTEEEKKIKDELESMPAYPKILDEGYPNITENERQERTKKNKIAYFMQQRGNLGIKELYEELIQNKEQAALDVVSQMEALGKTEEEIISELGIDLERYTAFSKKISAEKTNLNDEMKAVLIADRLLKGKKWKEIFEELGIDEKECARIYKEDKKSSGIIDSSLKDKTLICSNIEKRKLDEIISGKSTLELYVEYEMSFQELDENSGEKKERYSTDSNIEDRREGELFALAAQCDHEVSLEERESGIKVTQDLKNEDRIREEGQHEKVESPEL